MGKEKNKSQLLLYGISIIAAWIILIDFAAPGDIFREDVLKIEKEKQQYFNAGGNSHYSYKVITPKHHFSVSKDFAKSAQNQKIKYSVSLIFKEINGYGLSTSENSTIYSFRIISGLIFPSIAVITIIIAYRSKKNMNTLVFVFQVMLIANLIILIL